MATLTYDTKTTNSLTGDNRSSAGTLNIDGKTIFIWIPNYYPWLLVNHPWAQDGICSTLTLDIRN